MSQDPRSSLISLQALFKDFSQTAIDVTTPSVKVTLGGQVVTLDTVGSVLQTDGTYSMTPLVPPVTGTYKFIFLTSRMRPGLYNLEFTGSIFDAIDNVNKTLIVNGKIAIGEINRTQDWINRVVQNLMDDHPEEYRLDEPAPQWSVTNIYNYLREVMDDFNNLGPRRTTFDMDGLPDNLDSFMVGGAVCKALYARSRLERANEMQYSDQHSLNIQRADFYKSLADTLWKDWQERVVSWKKATPPKPMGLTNQRLPFRVFRVIGLLPNYQTFFSG